MVSSNGKTLRLLLDTGNANAYLDRKAALAMSLALKPMIGGDGKPIEEMQEAIVPGAKLGELPMGDFPFVVLDTSEPKDENGQKVTPLPGDGALTYGSFKNRILQLDFGKHVVRISEPLTEAQTCPGRCGDLSIKHFGNFGPPTITTTGFTVNGQPVEAQIDTLFAGTMLIYPASVKRLNLNKESKSKKKEQFPFTGGGLKLAKAEGASEAFADLTLLQDAPLYFTTPEGRTPGDLFDATVGVGLLSHGVITLDFKDMKIWIN
jgi:hypothetical protein